MPTVVIGNNTGDDFTGVDETRMTEIDPTINYGTDSVIATSNFGGGDLQTYVICFTGLSNITGPVTVSSATLDLWIDSINSTPEYNLHRLLTSFTEGGATWNSRNGSNNWNTGGARGSGTDHSATVSATVSGGSAGGYQSISSAQLATDVQNWINGVNSNFGWVGLPTGDNGDAYVYVSSEGTDENRPKLTVIYTASGTAYTLIVEPFSFSTSFQDASIDLGIGVEPYTYSYNLQDVNFVYTPAPPPGTAYEVDIAPLAYQVTLNSVTFLLNGLPITGTLKQGLKLGLSKHRLGL
jgi:hypothetical protein